MTNGSGSDGGSATGDAEDTQAAASFASLPPQVNLCAQRGDAIFSYSPSRFIRETTYAIGDVTRMFSRACCWSYYEYCEYR